MKSEMTTLMNKFLIDLGIKPHLADWLDQAAILVIILILALLAGLVARFLLVTVLRRLARKAHFEWAALVFSPHLLKKIADMLPVVMIYILIPLAFPPHAKMPGIIQTCCVIYIVIVVLLFFNAFFKLMFQILNHRDTFRDRPLKGVLQVIQVTLVCIGIIVVVSLLLGQKPLHLLAGLGASAAILMLVFKDSILGFVAGIQLSANHMLKPGDWITVPGSGVDGTVLEVTLNTVKVQNFDNTILTIPPYTLTSQAFQNWQGMADSGGRRVMRSVSIDINSVRFCTPEMIARYKQIPLLKEWIAKKEAELAGPDSQLAIDDMVTIELHRLTNIGVFRAYLDLYIHNLAVVNKDLDCMVRHLQPTENGIPMQLYFFSSIKEWATYEGIQADVFDHVMAVIPEFDLRIFQNPSGLDLRNLADQVAAMQQPSRPAAASPSANRTTRPAVTPEEDAGTGTTPPAASPSAPTSDTGDPQRQPDSPSPASGATGNES